MRGIKKYKKVIASLMVGAMVFAQPVGNMYVIAEDDVGAADAIEEVTEAEKTTEADTTTDADNCEEIIEFDAEGDVVGDASAGNSITADMYAIKEGDNYLYYEINQDGTYENITVPDGAMLNIAGCDVVVNGTLTLGKASALNIWESNGEVGTVKASNFIYVPGSAIIAYKNSSLPVINGTVIDVYDYFEHMVGPQNISGDTEWSQFVFEYKWMDDGDDSRNGWLCIGCLGDDGNVDRIVYNYQDYDNDIVYLTELTIETGTVVQIEGADVRVEGNVSIAADAELMIFDMVQNGEDEDESNDILHSGSLSWEGNLKAEEGARLSLGSIANLPDGIDLYTDVDGQLVPIKDDPGWSTFEYHDNKWIQLMNGPDEPGDYIDYNWERLAEEFRNADFAFGDIYSSAPNDGNRKVLGSVGHDGTVDTDDIAYGIARTLYQDNLIYYENGGGGRYQREGEALGLKPVPNDERDSTYAVKYNENLALVYECITVTKTQKEDNLDNYINFANYGSVFDYYDFSLDLRDLVARTSKDDKEYSERINELGLDYETVVISGKAALMTIDSSWCYFIVSVSGNHYLYTTIQDVKADVAMSPSFIHGVANSEAIIIVDNSLYDNEGNLTVDVFGNFVSMGETLSDPTARESYAATFNGGVIDNSEYHIGGKLAVFSTAYVGIAVEAVDKDKTGPAEVSSIPAYMDINSYYPVYEVSDSDSLAVDYRPSSSFDVFYGCDKIKLTAIKALQDKNGNYYIGLVDDAFTWDIYEETYDINKNFVSVTAGGSDYTDTYLNIGSDFYENIGLKMTLTHTFEDESICVVDYYVNVHRTGIQVNCGRTAGNNNSQMDIFHGHNRGQFITQANGAAWTSNDGKFGYVVYATFYYSAEDNMLVNGGNKSAVDLYVTATFADGHKESKLVSSTYFTPAEEARDAHGDLVINSAMDDYVIYSGSAENAPICIEAIAVPKANSSGIIPGALFGEGQGVYAYTQAMD